MGHSGGGEQEEAPNWQQAVNILHAPYKSKL